VNAVWAELGSQSNGLLCGNDNKVLLSLRRWTFGPTEGQDTF
jgi:hypothetical protein